jgi:hypothetical protein
MKPGTVFSMFACLAALCLSGCASTPPDDGQRQTLALVEEVTGPTNASVSVRGEETLSPSVKNYDQDLVSAIQYRWYQLLDALPGGRASEKVFGKVIIYYHLHSDGTVSDVKVEKNTVSKLYSALCQRAITDLAPFAPWPSDMRRQMGMDYRELRFSFYYD